MIDDPSAATNLDNTAANKKLVAFVDDILVKDLRYRKFAIQTLFADTMNVLRDPQVAA